MIDAFKNVQTRLVEEQQEIGSTMSSGGCDTIEEYKRLVGVVAGLELALLFLQDERKKYVEDDSYD